jgi:hypothetical protein
MGTSKLWLTQTSKARKEAPMNKCIRIPDFAEHLFLNPKAVQQASEILEGIMQARSPRLSDIAAHMPGTFSSRALFHTQIRA